MNPIFQKRIRNNKFEHSASSSSPSRQTKRSPSRLNSLKSSLSEDIEPEDSVDTHVNYATSQDAYAAAAHAQHPSASKPPPSTMFVKAGSRNNSSSLLLHSPTYNNPGHQMHDTPNALETKQNLLAEATLSTEENEIRQIVEAKAKGTFESGDTPSPDMTLQDIEDYEDFNLNPRMPITYVQQGFPGGADGGSTMLHYHKAPEQVNPCVVKTLDAKTWSSLKTTVFGTKGSGSLEGWIGQGFTFSQKVPLGLLQRKGGPCGVLSVLQTLILKNLLFGSEYFDDNFDGPNEEILNLDDNSVITNLSSKRIVALMAALVEILWKCASHSPHAHVTICWAGSCNITSPAPEMYIISTLDELKKYVRFNLHRFDCIGLVYSVVLTRGLERVQEDMDFPNSPLLGQHGYCTQELMNLLTIGKAISNAFDNEVVLGDKTLKGISSPVDIGLLSLFEYYDSCQVGNYLKCPKYPIWIVCSESHFSVLFSNDLSISNHTHPVNEPSIDSRVFNLYYYDGLAHQEQLINLTITEHGGRIQPHHRLPSSSKPTMFNNNLSSGGVIGDEDSTPPLEKCIRTKWKNAAVNWNDTEPIL